MPRRELLSPAQREVLLSFPTEEVDLLRHYTFNTHDLVVIRCRQELAHRKLGKSMCLLVSRTHVLRREELGL